MKVMLAGYVLGQGGIQNHLKWLAKALIEEGLEAKILSLGITQSPENDLEMIRSLQDDGIEVSVCTPYPNKKRTFNLRKLNRFWEIRSIINEFSPDVYLAVGTGWNLYLPPLLTKTNKKLIFHEVMSGVPDSWRDSRWCVCGWFDDVVGQSRNVADTFARCFGWKKPVAALPAIPEPLELTASLPHVSDQKISLGKAKAALFSRLAPHKQAFWLVQQWDLLKDYLAELHIHGGGAEERVIREYIEAQGIGDRVKCFGAYPTGQAYVDLISSYDLTLLPTIGKEGAPLVLLESMACGVPFVAFGVGGIPDYGVNNPNCMVVNPELPQNFIGAVRQMISQLAQGQISQTETQRYYLENYSFEVLKKAWSSYLLENS